VNFDGEKCDRFDVYMGLDVGVVRITRNKVSINGITDQYDISDPKFNPDNFAAAIIHNVVEQRCRRLRLSDGLAHNLYA